MTLNPISFGIHPSFEGRKMNPVPATRCKSEESLGKPGSISWPQALPAPTSGDGMTKDS